MAKRIRRVEHTEEVRKRIQTSQLINRLRDHVVGKVELSATQVRAAEILLKKAIPDLASVDVEHSGEVTAAQPSLDSRGPGASSFMDAFRQALAAGDAGVAGNGQNGSGVPPVGDPGSTRH